MVTEIWDYINSKFRKWRSDAEGRGVTLPEAQYLAVDPDLADEEYHHLTLTSDGKLRVDDPTTQTKVDDVLALLTLAMEKATGPDYDQDTDSQEAIREVCDSILSEMSD